MALDFGVASASAVPVTGLPLLAESPTNDAFPVRHFAFGAMTGVAAGSPMVSGFPCRPRLCSW